MSIADFSLWGFMPFCMLIVAIVAVIQQIVQLQNNHVANDLAL